MINTRSKPPVFETIPFWNQKENKIKKTKRRLFACYLLLLCDAVSILDKTVEKQDSRKTLIRSVAFHNLWNITEV